MVTMSLAAVASASAHEFVANKTGTLKGVSTNHQKFKTSSGTVECLKETSEGKIESTKSETNIEKVKYEECTAFGFVVSKVSEAEFEFNAAGTATVRNKIVLEIEAAEPCTITINKGTANTGLKTVTYKNVAGGTMTVEAAVKGITYTTSGGECGSAGTNGEYSGNTKAELIGGTIEWV
jgi:hypothetical protein